MFGRKEEEAAATDCRQAATDGGASSNKAASALSAFQEQLIINRLRGHIDKAVAEGLAKIQRSLDAPLANHREILRSHAAAINKHGDRLQVILLADGRELVDLPEHMEIRKIPKGR